MPPDPSHSDTTNTADNMTNDETTPPISVAVDINTAPLPDANTGSDHGDDGKVGVPPMESPKMSTAVDSDDPVAPPSAAEADAAVAAGVLVTTTSVSGMIVQTAPAAPPSSSSNNSHRIPYKYDPDKITLRFLFANRDGLTVTITCKPSDTVGEVKGALISVWPKDMPHCDDGDDLRLVCMGKGFLSPDARTLEDCQIPVFKTHPTPVNVSVKPSARPVAETEHLKKKAAPASATASTSVVETGQGCCIIS